MNLPYGNLLALETSTETLSVAVQRMAPPSGAPGGSGRVTVWQHDGPGGAQASATLIPIIERLMQQAGLDFTDLAAIAFGSGPGSFTGLRTACSVAQGLAYAAGGGVGLPVLPVDSLLAVAEEARFQRAQSPGALQPASGHLQVAALLDARMDELYFAYYAFDSELWTIHESQRLIRPEELGLALASAAWPGEVLLAGNVFAAYGQRLALAGRPCQTALPTASALLRLAPQLLREGRAVSATEAMPVYIRDKVAKTTAERMLEKAATLP